MKIFQNILKQISAFIKFILKRDQFSQLNLSTNNEFRTRNIIYFDETELSSNFF